MGTTFVSMMKYSLLTILPLSLIISANAQTTDTANVPVWAEMMQDPDANFYETQHAFEMYFEGRERQRGDGWKVFKRWENLKKDQINLDGTYLDLTAQAEAFEAWQIWNNQTNTQGIESENGAWEEVGPIAKPVNGTGQPNGNGRLNTIGFHPTNENIFWVGAPAGGLWKTTDGGITWSSNTDELATLGVSSILIDPTNTNVMYIGTGDRDAGDSPSRGVYKSTDGGTNWTQSNSGMGNRTVGAMIMHHSNSSYILAATSGGVYRTQNGGSTWTLESTSANYKDIKYKPGSSTVVYATETSSGAGFYRSTNGGDTWTQVTSGLPTSPQRYSIGVSEDDANVVYVLCSVSSAFGGLYKSSNSGVSFSTQSTTPNILGWNENGSSSGGQGWYDLTVAVDPDDASIVYVGGVNIFKSTNSGVTWDCSAHWVGSSTAASVHADQHWLSYSPVSGKLYICNDGGIYYTADDGATWPELSSGLGIGQLYKIGVSQQTHAHVINGYQDNGTALWSDTLFRTVRGGDGMECIIDYSDDAVMYASVYYGRIARSLNNGYNMGGFAGINTNGITESGAWVTPYILDKDNPNIMFIGYKNIWKTTSAKSSSVNFSPISNSLAGSNSSNMRQMRQSKVDGNRMFAIRSDNKFFRTDNVHATTPSWTDLTSLLPGSGTLRDVETDPFDKDILWISRGNLIWKSVNGGTSWSNYTGNLPNLSYNTIIADPLSNGGLYVGGYAGIYYRDNSLSNWTSFFDDFPTNVSSRELEIYHPQGNWQGSRIRSATYGRGLWESDLYDPGTLDPLAFMDLSVDSTDVCSLDTIDLFNNTAYGVTSTLWVISPSSNVTFVNGTSDTSMNPSIVLSDTGYYSVKLVVANGNGSDSIIRDSAIVVSNGLSFPWFDDFEGNNGCATSSCVTTCDLKDWRNVQNGGEDDIDWRVDAGGTPSGGTGPSVDFNPGTDSTNYLYLEATGCASQLALLESPCILIDEVTSPEFKFAFHMYGWNAWIEDLEVDILSNGSWTNLWSNTGSNLGNVWNTDSISLSSYIGESVKLRFAGTSGSGWQADIAIDDLHLTAAPMADFSVSDTKPCKNTSINIFDESTQDPTSWSWTISPNTHTYVSGTNSSSQNPVVEFNAEGEYDITLYASNEYGADFEVKSDHLIIADPEATLSSNSSANSFCLEDSAWFEVLETGFTNYTFYNNGTQLVSSTSNEAVLTGLQNGDSIVAVVTDTLGCIGESNVIPVLVWESPTTVFVSSDPDNEICDGDTVTFTNLNVNLSNYNFQLNGTSVQNGTANSWATGSLISNDEVWTILTDTNGCEGLTDTIITTVLPLPPTPSIAVILDSLECSIPADMYLWKFDDSTSTTTNQREAKEGDGTYLVRIFDGGCWSLWSEPFVITGFQGVNDVKMKVYPSPSSDIVHIEFINGATPTDGDIRVVDLNGKLVIQETFGAAPSVNRTSLNIAKLPSGVYTIVMELDGKQYAIPIVKERR